MTTQTKQKETTTFVIQSQPIYDRNSLGGRYTGGRVFRGRYETWNKRADNALNFRDAVLRCITRCKRSHVGSIILARALYNGHPTSVVTKLVQIKWGHDNKFFLQYEGTIGNWWKSKARL